MSRLPARSRLVFSLTLVLTSTFLATSLVNYRVTRTAVREELIHSALPLTRDNITSEIRASLLEPLHVSSLMANDTFLHNWAMNGEVNVDRITEYLSEIVKRYGYFTAYFISEQTKNYYYADGILKQISRGDSHDVWYYRFVTLDTEYELDVDTNEAADDRLTIFINYRIENTAGRFLGVTGVGLEMDSMARLLRETESKYRRSIYLVNDHGIVQAHSRAELIEATDLATITGRDDLQAKVLAEVEDPVDEEYTNEHGVVLLTSRYIPELGWHLIVEQEERSALGIARRNLLRTLAIGLVSSLAILTLTILTVNSYQRRIEAIAVTDELTRLANRRAFRDRFARVQAEYERDGQPFSLLMVDLNGFKNVNDKLGHAAGDRVLRDVAAATLSQVRPGDDVARWGGDEFTVLCRCDVREAEIVRDRICNAIASTTDVTASGGVAQFEPGDTFDTVLQRADAMMYEAKITAR